MNVMSLFNVLVLLLNHHHIISKYLNIILKIQNHILRLLWVWFNKKPKPLMMA